MTIRKITVLALSLLFSAVASSNVWACTGRPYSTSMKYLDDFDLWVRATVIDRDDRGYNAILFAEEYYKGDGPRIIVVQRYIPGLESVSSVRGYSTECMGDGGGQEYKRGRTGYFGLKPNGDGTYTDWRFGSAQYYARGGIIPYYEHYNTHEISEADFVTKLLEMGERDAPAKPRIDDVQRYPLMRYLMIRTETGARYQVNPDRSVMPVPEDAPLAISPDGAHWAQRVDENTIGFGRPYQQQWIAKALYFTEVPGREVRFSNDSNLAAVWDDDQLSIYMFDNTGYGGYGAAMVTNLIATVALDTVDDNKLRVEWSADSTTLVWQDRTGIWRWNLFDEAEPTLIAVERDCFLMDISDGGRYVRYGTARGWTLYDNLTKERFPNALAAPGEKIYVVANAEADALPPGYSNSECVPPLKRNCVRIIDTGLQAVSMFAYPSALGNIGLLYCEYDGLCDERKFSWHPSIRERWYISYTPDYEDRPWRQYAYDPFYDRKAILYGDFQIDLETRADMIFKASDDVVFELLLDSLDLKDIVDSPIASIAWGQPIFYHAQAMAASEYMPRTVTAYDINSAPGHETGDA